MRLIVEVLRGRDAGEKAFVEPGKPLRVGQSPRAELTVTDGHMTPLHFMLEWNGSSCVLSELKSYGITLNGEAV